MNDEAKLRAYYADMKPKREDGIKTSSSAKRSRRNQLISEPKSFLYSVHLAELCQARVLSVKAGLRWGNEMRYIGWLM